MLPPLTVSTASRPWLYQGQQVLAFEAAQAEQGQDLYQWLQQAAQSLAWHLELHFPSVTKVLILVGSGNNGGDGYALAKLLLAKGIEVTLLVALPAKSDFALRARHELLSAFAPRILEQLPDDLSEQQLVVDTVFGCSFRLPLPEAWAVIFRQLNSSGIPILAVDLPSGLDANSAQADPDTLRATHTVQMLAAKFACHTAWGAHFSGQSYVATLGQEIQLSVQPRAHLLTDLAAVWPKARDKTWHKGRSGTVWIVGGVEGMQGAAILAGLAALRAGAGKVIVLCPKEQQASLAAMSMDLMVMPFAPQSLAEIKSQDVLLLGPGLGRSHFAQQVISQTYLFSGKLVLDADALFAMAQGADWPWATKVITPHPLEAARLLGLDTEEVLQQPLETVQRLAQLAQGLILKVNGSLLHCQGQYSVVAAGNPGMAKAGMGDVLAGMLSALWAQDLPLGSALCLAALWHAKAGDALAAEQGELSLLASDMLGALMRARPRG